MLTRLDNDSNYYYLFIGEYWQAFHYNKVVPELIKRITNKKEIGLMNTADLIIWERVDAGDMIFYGHGGIVSDDLFTVAGRANCLLKKITGENYGNVSMYSTEEDLKKLQNHWIAWLKKI